jgi:hypothetical protein
LYHFICSHLIVIRLPLKHGTRWLLTLISNTPGATDEEIGSQLCLYYEVYSRRELIGVVLTAEDMGNIKAITGTETHALLDFLVVKFSDKASSQALGIPPGRARSVVRRYDSLCERLHCLRAAASLQVAGAIVVSKGRGVIDQKAVRYEMHRRAEADNFLKIAPLERGRGKVYYSTKTCKSSSWQLRESLVDLSRRARVAQRQSKIHFLGPLWTMVFRVEKSTLSIQWHAEQWDPSLVLRSPGPRFMRSCAASAMPTSV